MGQILLLSDLAMIRKKLDGVVLIGGVFDVLHAGHIEHLEEAKSLGNYLIVHVASDKRVAKKKGKDRPFMPQEDRSKILAAIRHVDFVFIEDVPHYDRRIIDMLRPDVLMLNSEAATDEIKEYIATIDSVLSVVISDAPKRNYSSKIIEKLKQSI